MMVTNRKAVRIIMRFNTEKHEKFYNRVKSDAINKYNFTEEEMARCDLSKLHKQTKSSRILRMLNLAYQLGVMRGIKDCDDVFHSKLDTRGISLMSVPKPKLSSDSSVKVEGKDNKTRVKDFHKSRFMFAILPNGTLVYTTDDVRSHKEWLSEEYKLMNYDINKATRGYALDSNIIFYTGKDFGYNFYVKQDAYKYGEEIANKLSLTKANVYVGLIIGELGDIWKPDTLLYVVGEK